MTKRWVNRPEGSTWGDWGDDDQLGRMNLVTPEKRLAAVAEVKATMGWSPQVPVRVAVSADSSEEPSELRRPVPAPRVVREKVPTLVREKEVAPVVSTSVISRVDREAHTPV